MEPVIIKQHPRLLLAGYSFFGDPFHANAGWTEANEIGRLWKRLLATQPAYAVMYEIHLQNSETPTTGEFEVFVGYEIADVEAVPFELCVKVLPPTDYALFTLRGDQMMGEEPIVDQWLATNPYEIAHTYFVQRYDERFKGLDRVEESVLDFLVPVTPIEPQADDPD